jgi:hypothetical protein
MKKQIIILTILLTSTIWLFGQFGGGDINDMKAKTAKYDSKRVITDELSFLPLWMANEMIIGYTAKGVVTAATTANITLSGSQTIDSHSAVTNDTILVKDQTLPEQNGVYLVGVPWTRINYMNTWVEIYKSSVIVRVGGLNSGSTFSSYMDATGTLDSDTILWNLTAKSIPFDASDYRVDSIWFTRQKVHIKQGSFSDSTGVLFTEGDFYETVPGLEFSGAGNPINGDLTMDLTTGYEIPTTLQLDKLDSLPHSLGNWGGLFGNHLYSYYLDYANLTGKPTIPIISNAAYGVGWATDYTQGASRAALYAKIETLGAGAHSFSTGHTDVLTSGLAINDIPQWNGTKWVNITMTRLSSLLGDPFTNASYSASAKRFTFYAYWGGPYRYVTLPDVSTIYSGLMPSVIFNKVTGIEDSAQHNVNADWDTINPLSDSYIRNKPDVITFSDTSGTIPTKHYVDSVASAGGGGDSYWIATENLDTIYPDANVVRLDTVVMGQNSSVFPDNASFSNVTNLYNGTTVTPITNTIRYAYNESGEIRYKIYYSVPSYRLARSYDSGATWQDLRTITYSTAANTALKCSNYGDKVVFTEKSNIDNINYMYVSNDYGATFVGYVVGLALTGLALDISDNGLLVGAITYTQSSSTPRGKVYLFRTALKDQGNIDEYNASTNPWPIPYDIKISNDSTIYYTVLKNGSAQDRCLYSVSKAGVHTLKQNSLYQSFQFDLENNVLYVSDSSKIYSSTNGGTTLSLIKDLNPIRVWNINANKDGAYLYIEAYSSGNKFYRSVNSGTDFTLINSSGGASQFQNIEINEGQLSTGVEYYYQNGRMNFNHGGISMAPDYTPVNGKDVMTYEYFMANGGVIGGGITEVNTVTNGFLSGGATVGPANLRLSFLNCANRKTSASLADRFIIGDADVAGMPAKYILLSDLKLSLGTGGVVNSVVGGNAMTTTTGTLANPIVNMGLPSLINRSSTNNVLNSSHSHWFDMNTFKLDDLGDVPYPTIANYYLQRNASNTEWIYSAGTGSGEAHYLADSSFIKTAARSWNSSLAKKITTADTTRWASGGSGGSSISTFIPLTGTNPSWDAATSRNARLTMPSSTCTLNITVLPTNGDIPACLVVYPYSTTQTLTFPAGLFNTNGHTKSFNIEPGLRWKFTFTNTGSEIIVDYATSTIAY